MPALTLSFWSQTVFLLFSILLAFIWTQNPVLSPFNLQLTALLVIFYLASRLLSRQKINSFLSSIIFVTVALMLIFSTGGVASPLFFLLDFLLFALALLFEPFQTAMVAVFIFLILLTSGGNLNSSALVNLFSLLLITPLAVVFGRKYLENLASRGKIELLETTISREETDTLFWLSTVAKSNITVSLDVISQVIASNKLPYYLQEKLKIAYTNLISLYQSADELKQDIDRQTD